VFGSPQESVLVLPSTDPLALGRAPVWARPVEPFRLPMECRTLPLPIASACEVVEGARGQSSGRLMQLLKVSELFGSAIQAPTSQQE
jgi:hypothetical protein